MLAFCYCCYCYYCCGLERGASFDTMNAYCQVMSIQVVEVWPHMDKSTTRTKKMTMTMTAIDDTIDTVGAIYHSSLDIVAATLMKIHPSRQQLCPLHNNYDF